MSNNGPDWIQSIQVVAEGTEPTADTPRSGVSPGGRYTLLLPPGRYYVRVKVGPTFDFTTPNVGDDATDSDVVFTSRAWDGAVADSAVVDVPDGQETFVDIGLVSVQS